MNKKILIIGFGTVGQGFFELFHEKRPKIRELNSVEISEIVGMRLGYEKDPGSDVLERVKLGGGLREGPRDVIEAIRNSDADVVCEFTRVNMKNGEPAYSHIREALGGGKHVITTNKGPIALRYEELQSLASSNSSPILRFKGTVMSGTPSFDILSLLPGLEVKRVRGILNGTSNFILGELAEGKSFEESLKLAQMEGYAEADPMMDVDGYDAALKAMIISNVLEWRDERHSLHGGMEVSGIRNVRLDDVRGAGGMTKLLVTIDKDSASVKPTRLESGDLLSHVDGVQNALELETDTLGRIFSIGPGAGRRQTAQAALTDLVAIIGG
jgi:homoserine dehydrogenase